MATNFLPGSAALADIIDHNILVATRDGSRLFGTLRSYDQFGTVVLQTEKSTLMVRGENIAYLGEMKSDGSAEINNNQDSRKSENNEDPRKAEIRNKTLQALGFSIDEGVIADHYK